jgi:SAM-dependent methyltransferase
MADIPTLAVSTQQPIRRVAICVPCRNSVDINFLQSYITALLWFMKQPGVVPIPIFSEAMPLDNARNDIVRSALLAKCDYYLWLDSDIILPEKHLELLWKTLIGNDGSNGTEAMHIVSGIYFERAPPYNPVLRMEAPLGKMIPKYSYDEEKPFTVDGAGFGCILHDSFVIRELVKNTKGRPFQFTADCSEDLFFCREARKLTDPQGNPVKIWVQPAATCGHVGGTSITQWHYLHYKLDEYSDIAELAQYLDDKAGGQRQDKELLLEKCNNAAIGMYVEWKHVFGDRKSEDIPESELDEFYRNTKLYLYDLTRYWYSDKKKHQAVLANVHTRHKRVLDYGCGIGNYGLAVLEDFPESTVDFCDINTSNLDYLAWRLARRGDEVSSRARIGDGGFFSEQSGEKYDLIFCIDVLEHLKFTEAYETLAKIRESLNSDGLLLAFVAPQMPYQPQHISAPDPEKCGFLKVGEYAYVRDDSSAAVSFRRMMGDG